MRHKYFFFEIMFRFLGSLKLTMGLLILAMALVFFSTLEQVHLGVHAVQAQYFQKWIILMPLPYDFAKGQPWLYIPLLGGYGLGILFLLNLGVAFRRVFQWKLKKIGIACIHEGLMILILSGFIGAYFQEESQMWIEEGQTVYYSESTYDNELVLIDVTEPDKDVVYAINTAHLDTGGYIHEPVLPFKLRIIDYYPNAAIGFASEGEGVQKATQGSAAKMKWCVFSRPLTYKEDERNAVTAYVEIIDLKGESLGIWLVSNILDDRFPQQTFIYEGRTYLIALRFKRYYWPMGLELKDFVHTVYPGTTIPQNFMSHLVLHEATGVSRPVTIRMNEPLRTHGGTFYQASFSPNEQASMLQVVKNPGWLIPYLGVLFIACGLLFHFGYGLWNFLNRRSSIDA